MGINLDEMKQQLDLEDADLISPISILDSISNEIEKITKGLVKGVVSPYDGPIKSYKTASSMAALAAAVVLATEQNHDIQDDLGEIGYKESQYDFCLVTPSLPNYKYRVMFLSVGIGGYPAELVLQEEVGREVFNGNNKYIIIAQNQGEFESIIQRIFSTEKVIGVTQELIYAAKNKQEQGVDVSDIPSLNKQEGPNK